MSRPALFVLLNFPVFRLARFDNVKYSGRMNNHPAPATGDGVGRRIRLLRNRHGLSVRALARASGVTAAMISCVEHEKNSPSIATLQKILAALNTDVAAFFGAAQPAGKGPVFPREGMRLASDAERSYTIIFPKTDQIKVEMLDEVLLPGRRRPPYENLPCDVAGYVISGRLLLEVKPQPAREVRPGDAFYVPAGAEHRGYAAGPEPVRLITTYVPPRY